MPQKVSTKLGFVVVHHKTGKGKCPIATTITVRMGDMPIAVATRGGKYSQADAEREFTRNGKTFTPVQPGWDMAVSLKAV